MGHYPFKMASRLMDLFYKNMSLVWRWRMAEVAYDYGGKSFIISFRKH